MGDTDLTETGVSSADLLGVRVELLAETLTDHVVREVASRGARGGPLMPLAIQLGQDATHLQGQRIEVKLDQGSFVARRLTQAHDRAGAPDFVHAGSRTAFPAAVSRPGTRTKPFKVRLSV